ncbi:MAG: glycosyltransferase family 2 protein [Gemmatimonadota bacterium]|nr:glycosyltransferase family 2 protein [Gemmatimonadota bacterium]
MIEEILDDAGPTLPQAVSVVIPAYNEGAHVASQVRDVERVLKTTGWTYEIIVVDDGSKDDTAVQADTTGARVLRRIRNRGYGAGLKLGIRHAQYGYILITDADGTYPVEAIPAMLASADRHAMVVGARTGTTVHIPLIRRPAKAFIRWLASYLSGQHIPDINSGLRLMRKDLVERYEHLLPDGFSFTTTITLASICNGYAVQYQSIDYHARLGESKIRARHAYDFTLLVLRVIVYFNPLKVFLPLGAFLASIGLGKLVYDIWKDNLSETTLLDLLGAMLVWSVGMLADQNARTAVRR